MPAQGLPHVVVFPFPAQGHINPGLQFAQLLASFCKVTFINTSHNIAKLRPAHLDLGPCIRLRALADDGDHGLGPDFFARVELMGGLLESLLLELLHRHTPEHGSMDGLSSENNGAGDADDEWPPPICLISDMFLSWVQDIADKLDIPRFILFTPSPATLVLVLSLTEMLLQGRLPCHDALDAARMQPLNLPGLTHTLRLTDIPSHLLLPPSAFMFDYFIRHSKHVPDAAGILLNSFYHLQSSAIDAARDLAGPFSGKWADLLQKHLQHRVMPMGPLLPSYVFDSSRDMKALASRETVTEDGACLQWLDSHPPSSVVYVSFGSMAELAEKQICELARGLQASGKPFLWVVRGESAQYIPQDMRLDMERGVADVVPMCASKESLSEPGACVRTQAGNWLVVSWAPQLDVLLHPSTGIFLSHCGWNSTLEAISAGVPMLCWPLFAEQKMNCRVLVDELHMAMEFSKQKEGLVGREEVERVVREAMETEQGRLLKKHALEWKGSAREAVSDGGPSNENVRAFGSFLSSLHGAAQNML